jgi:hypothetical protein
MTKRGPVYLLALVLVFGGALSACGGGSSSVTAFCSLMRTDNQKFAKTGGTAAAADALQAAAAKSPSAIKSEMNDLASAEKSSLAGHVPSNATITKLGSEETNIAKYVKDKCNVDLSTG